MTAARPRSRRPRIKPMSEEDDQRRNAEDLERILGGLTRAEANDPQGMLQLYQQAQADMADQTKQMVRDRFDEIRELLQRDVTQLSPDELRLTQWYALMFLFALKSEAGD